MATVSKSNQVLYTSGDYTSAFQSANKIEKAVALVEQGNNVVQFSGYIDEYTKLMKRLISTNDLGHNINPNMRNAHYTLTKQIQGLEKRVVAACVQAKILPPSKELIQMLKVDETSSSKQVKNKWTVTAIAKYTAIGGAATLAYSQLLTAIAKIPQSVKTTFSVAQKVIPQAGNAANDAFTAAYDTFTNIGNGINALRHLGSKTGIPTLSSEDSAVLGVSTVMDLVVKQLVWKTVKPFTPFLPKSFSPVIESGIFASTACDALLPGCTKKAIDGAKSVTDTAANYPGASAAATLGGILPVLYYGDAISQNFLSAAGFLKPMGYSALAIPLATTAVESAMKSVNPQLYADLVKQYPYMIPATNILGVAGSVLGPVYSNGAITAAANAASGAALNAGAAAAQLQVAAQNAALLAAGAPQNAAITQGMQQVMQQAADRARDTTLFRQRLRASLVSAFTLSILPAIVTGLREKGPELVGAVQQSATNGWIKEDIDYAKKNPKSAAAIIGAAAGTGAVVSKYRGNSYRHALGSGLLTSLLPNLFKYASQGIYYSCTDQDGHCSQAMAAASAAIIKSRTDGLIKTAEDYLNYGMKTAGDYVSDSRKNGLLKQVEDYTNDNPKAVVATAIGGAAGMVYGGYLARNGYPATRAITAAGLMGTGLTYGATQLGNVLLDKASPLFDAVSQSATNGYIKKAKDFGTGVVEQGTDYANKNPKTSRATAMGGAAGMVYGGYLGRNNRAIQVIATPVGGLIGTALTYGAIQAGTPVWEAASESAKSGYLKDIRDYPSNNPTASVITAISGIAGSIFGPWYFQNAITQAGQAAFNLAQQAGLQAARHAVLNGGGGPGGLAGRLAAGVIPAANRAHNNVVIRQNVGTGLATAVGTAIATQVAIQVGTALKDVAVQSATDGYLKDVGDYLYDNLKTSVASVITGLSAGLLAKYKYGTGNAGAIAAGLTATGVTHPASKGLAAARDMTYQSATDGYLKDVGDYLYDNLKTSVASVITGLSAGLLAKYKYGTGNAGAIAAGLTATGVTHPASKGLAAARDMTYQSATNGYLKDVGDYLYDNLKTSVASIITGLSAGLLAKYKYGTGNAGAIAAGLTATGVTHPASKGLAAARDMTYQSATNGYLKDVGDYLYDNLKTSVASVITGLATGLVAKYRYGTGYKGVIAAGLTATGVTHPVSKGLAAARDWASQSATNGNLKPVVDYPQENQILTGVSAGVGLLSAAFAGRSVKKMQQGATAGQIGAIATLLGAVTTVGTHVLWHLGSYVTNAVSSSCAEQDGYCNSLVNKVLEYPKTTTTIVTTVVGGVAAYRNRQTVGPFVTAAAGLAVTTGQQLVQNGKNALQKGWNRFKKPNTN